MTVRIPIVTDYNAKGVKQAQKSLGSLDKTVNKLGKTLGLTLSAAAVIQFGKASVKAFLEDDKAARTLAKTLDNLGLAFESPAVADYISNLEKATGVADDQLRPAFSALVVATHDVTKAQDMLGLALDVSAGTGKDLATVTAALQKAYLGNATSLGKLGTGLTKAEIASGDFASISQKLADIWGGSAAANAATLSGQIDILSRSVDNAKESIGKGLITALMALGKNNTIDELSTKIEDMGTQLGLAGVGLGSLIDKAQTKLNDNSVLKFLWDIVSSPTLLQMGIDALAKEGAKVSKALNANSAAANASAYDLLALRKKEIAAAEKLAKTRAKDNVVQKKAIIDQAKLKQAGAMFDLNRIQIEAALRGQISNEEKIRLELQKAILDEDAAKAEKLKIELMLSQQKTKELSDLLANLPKADDPFADWPSIIKRVNTLIDDLKLNITAAQLLGSKGIQLNAAGTNIATPIPSATTTTNKAAAVSVAPPPEYYTAPQTLAQAAVAAEDINMILQDINSTWASLGFDTNPTTGSTTNVIVNVAGSVTAEKDLTDTILQQLYVTQSLGTGLQYQSRTAL